MRKLLPAFAVLGIATAPAVAQTTPAEPAPAPKMVKKTVCERIETDRGTGSRLGPTTKVCKTVEVPASEVQKKPQGHSAHAH